MNLTTLTHRDALCLNARFTSREEAIHAKKLSTPLYGCAPASLICGTIAVSLYRILFAMPVRSIQA